jgi:hypothetical protein
LNTLENLIDQIENFSQFSDADKIRFFAWYLNSKLGKEFFVSSDIRDCFDQLKLKRPSNINPFLNSMTNSKTPTLLKNKVGYYLEKRIRDQYEEKYGKRITTIKVDRILSDLPTLITSPSEKIFLEEAINCYKAKAFRAAIVMTWILVYDHLCNYILDNSIVLNDFNNQLPKSFPKARIRTIIRKDDFSELKESEVLQVCRSANIISNDLNKILKEKLDKRNSAAHPSTITIFPHTTEEFIIDIINNVLLKLL